MSRGVNKNKRMALRESRKGAQLREREMTLLSECRGLCYLRENG